MGRTYEEPFYSVQVLQGKPMVFDKYLINRAEMAQDLIRYEQEFAIYDKKVSDFTKIEIACYASYKEKKLNGKMTVESWLVQCIQKENKDRRQAIPEPEEGEEAVEPVLLSLGMKPPAKVLEAQYFSITPGKNRVITDDPDIYLKAQFEGAIIRAIGLKNLEELAVLAKEPGTIVFTSLDTAALLEEGEEGTEVVSIPIKPPDDDPPADPPKEETPPGDPALKIENVPAEGSPLEETAPPEET